MARPKKRSLSQSQEDYLEAILAISGAGAAVGMRAIAARLGVSMPSANSAVARLSRMGLVNHGRYDYVELTREGKRLASAVASRHALLKRFLTEVLRVPELIAEEDACSIEHHLSTETVKAVTRMMEQKECRTCAVRKTSIRKGRHDG